MTVKYLPGFALIGTYSTAGDGSLTPSAVSALHPTATVEIGQYIAPNTPVFVLWNCLNIVQVQITGDNGIDPPFDSGLIDTTGLLSGSLDIVNGFTSDIILTFTAYDTIGHIAVVQDLMALYPPPMVTVSATPSSTPYIVLSTTNATAAITKHISSPLAAYDFGAYWNDFTLVDTLPLDAVVEGIFPVIYFSSSVYDLCNRYVYYGLGGTMSTGFYSPLPSPIVYNVTSVALSGSNAIYTGVFPGPAVAGSVVIAGFSNSANNGSFGGSTIVSSTPTTLTVYNPTAVVESATATVTSLDWYNADLWGGTTVGGQPAGSVSNDLNDLLGAGIQVYLESSALNTDIRDTMNVSSVGFAVMYTSATPVISNKMTPPFTVPSGRGLAWALPYFTWIKNFDYTVAGSVAVGNNVGSFVDQNHMVMIQDYTEATSRLWPIGSTGITPPMLLESYITGGVPDATHNWVGQNVQQAIVGAVTSGVFGYGEHVTQTVTGATGQTVPVSTSGSPLILGTLTGGTPDATHTWVGTSGAVFTPTAAPVSVYPTFTPTGLPVVDNPHDSFGTNVSTVASVVGGSAPIFINWSSMGIIQVRIHGDNGIDSPADSGLISTTGSGSYEFPNGFTHNINLTFDAYNAPGHIAYTQVLPVTITGVVYDYLTDEYGHMISTDEGDTIEVI